MIPNRREVLKAIGGLAVGGSLLARARASRVRYAKAKVVRGDGTVELIASDVEGVDLLAYPGLGPWWAYRYDRQGHLKAIAPVETPRPGTDLSPIEHRGGDVTFFRSCPVALCR